MFRNHQAGHLYGDCGRKSAVHLPMETAVNNAMEKIEKKKLYITHFLT